MRVLVTGAGGFLGSHLVASLTEDGHDVVGTSSQPEAELNARWQNGAKEAQRPPVRVIPSDSIVVNPPSLRSFDAIINCAFQCSYDTAALLQNKGAFRAFLAENGFPAPRAVVTGGPKEAAAASEGLSFPVIVKPTDAAGSKGVTRVESPDELGAAVDTALGFSLSRTVIVEEFIEKLGPQLSAEAFVVDGRVTALCFMDQLFDDHGPNPYAPVGNIMPSVHDLGLLQSLEDDFQRLSDRLDLRTGIFNVEVRIGANGVAYLLEVSPRGGGNRLAEFITRATGIDLITATVRATLGHDVDVDWSSRMTGVWAQRMLIDRQGGVFQGLDALDPPGGSVQDVTLWAEPGDRIEPFNHASYAFGSSWIQFKDRTSLDDALTDPSAFLVGDLRR